MRELQFRSLQQFIKKFDINKIGPKDIVISDIDGVYFKGIFDPREIIGLISKENLESLSRILNTGTMFIFLTNRLKLFKKFPYIKQISRTVKKTTTIRPKLYTNCSDFLDSEQKSYSIIMNAKKPSPESQKIIEYASSNFRKVFYFGSQDLPFYHNDIKLLKKVEKSRALNNLTYIEISSWKRSIK